MGHCAPAELREALVSWGCRPWFSGHTGVTLAWTDCVSEGPVFCMNKAMEEFTVLCPQMGR